MTDANKAMNPQHFGSHPADIQIRIWIISGFRIRIPDRFWPWQRFALSQQSLLGYTLCIKAAFEAV